jgi:DNA-directed RNA polymerase subunit RPC12/RpoP
MGMVTLKQKGYKCNRCEHEWVPRKSTEGEPRVCPACKSPYWNKPRKNKLKSQR